MEKHKFTDAIRRAVEESGMSRYKIAQATGIDPTTLHRLVRGGFLSAEGLDALAEFLDLHVVVGKPKNTKKGAK